MISDRTRSIIIYTVLIVWACNFFAPFFTDYHPDATINGIFMAIVGGALVIHSKSKGEEEETKDGDSRK